MLEQRALLTLYQVGQGMPYATLAGLPTLAPGDTVELAPGIYHESIRWTADGTASQPITIRGVGASRPIIDGTGVETGGGGSNPRALFQIEGNHYVIENLEFRNAHNGTQNAAGIRVLDATGTTIRWCRIDNNDNGVMSVADALLIEYSEIDHNGVDPYGHNVYLEDNRTTIQYSYIHDSNFGQNVKTRSHYTELLYNYIADSADGEVGLVDDVGTTITANSNALLLGNVIVSKPRSSASNQGKFIDFGQDIGGVHNGTLYLVNNTLIAGSPMIQFLSAGSPVGHIVATNNIFYGSDSIVGWSVGSITGANNWIPDTAGSPAGFTSTNRGVNPGFVDASARNYRLVASSPVLNLGVDNPTAVDGAGVAFSAVPRYEYVSPTARSPRLNDRQPDLGAFETQAQPGLVIGDAKLIEGNSGTAFMVFTVALGPAPTSTVTVDYATSDETASAGSDYLATSGKLTFAAGQTRATISVPVLGDTRWEGNERFAVTLSNPVGAPVARARAVGSLVEDDRPTRFDFGSTNSPGADGYVAVDPWTTYTSGRTYGWLDGTIYGSDHPTASTTNLTRDFVYTTDGTFGVDVPNGTYDITVTIGDGTWRRDQIAVDLEGTQQDVVSSAIGQFVTRTYRVSVSDGQLTLRIHDLGGDPYAVINALTIAPVGASADTASPRVISATPTGNHEGPVDRVALTFSEPIDPYSFTAASLVLAGPAGTIAPTAINVIDSTHYEVTFPTQSTPGLYRVTVGPAILDLAGNAMDQDQDGLNGEPAEDQFTSAFSILPPPVPKWLFDFGSASSPVAAGYTQVTGDSRYTAATGFGWLAGTVRGVDNPTSRTSDLNCDFVYTTDATFGVDVPNGTYDVTVTIGDATYYRDQIAVDLEGTQKAVVKTAGGQFAVQTYRVSVSDGQLTLRIHDLGGDPYAVINALTIAPVNAPPTETEIDAVGPRVISTSPSGSLDGPVDRVTLTFSEPIQDGSFTIADIASLTGPTGTITPTAVTRIDSTHYEVSFPAQSYPGPYVVTVGPIILDLAGNAMDQDQDGVNGESAEDRFTTSFSILPPTTPPTEPPTEPPSAWQYDFGSASSPVAAGYTQVTGADRYTAATGFGWLAGAVVGTDHPAAWTTDLNRDFVYTTDGTFAVDVPNGTYDVTVTMGDATYFRDQIAVDLEGVQAGIVSPGSRQVVSRTYRVSVSDGQLTLRIHDLGGDPYAVINALTIAPVPSPTSETGMTTTSLTSPLNTVSPTPVSASTPQVVDAAIEAMVVDSPSTKRKRR